MPKKAEEKQVVRITGEKYRVYIVGGGYDYIRLLYLNGYTGAKSLDDADIVLFTGGEDVNPKLYGETALRCSYFNTARDELEEAIYHEAIKRGIPCVGICRGGQFLNVMNKGSMWQDVSDHRGSHPMIIINADGSEGASIMATSTHHQMMIPAKKGAEVLAIAKEATSLQNDRQLVQKEDNAKGGDIEVVWYEETGCLCFQPHPELPSASTELINYFESLIVERIIPKVLVKGK